VKSKFHKDAEMNTSIREALAGSRWSSGQDLVGHKLALLAIRLLASVNLLNAAIFLKFAGVPDSMITIKGGEVSAFRHRC
jgi:hypothetical protein